MKKEISIMRVAAATLLTVACCAVQSKVRLPHLLADNMVLQSDTDVCLWGLGDKGSTVTVTSSWNGKKLKADVDDNGRWKTSVRTPKASYTPLELTFTDKDGSVKLGNILSGEVWVCAGQSNMEMTMEGFEACPTEGYLDALTDAEKTPGIRFVKIPSVASMTPLDDADCYWKVCGMETVGKISAVGYYFARLLNKAIDVPVGLVMANKGGTRVESWLTRENLERHTDVKIDTADWKQHIDRQHKWPLVWGNGTFNPILNFTVKGILFYQGCSNVGDKGNKYSELLALLVEQWRSQMGQGQLPFYFVEIAPCTWKSVDGLERAYLREQQMRAASLIPNSAIVCTNDCVYPHEWRQIHPAQKQKIGERLAFIALNRNYGKKDIMCESPRFKEMTVSNDTCTVFLENDYGAISRYEDLQGFEVAGADRVFHKAHAIHKKRKGIIITSPEVSHPVAVRYCFRNFQRGNVANRAGLPLFPFRTDNWD